MLVLFIGAHATLLMHCYILQQIQTDNPKLIRTELILCRVLKQLLFLFKDTEICLGENTGEVLT